jgi:hypothetical protein
MSRLGTPGALPGRTRVASAATIRSYWHELEEAVREESLGLTLGHGDQRFHLDADSVGDRKDDRLALDGQRRMNPTTDWILRWFHIMAGIMWIGLLYYFNFVNVAAVKEATAAGEAAPISKYVVPRALLFFRWGAVVTWIFGAALLGGYSAPNGMNGLAAAFGLQGTMAPIGLGAWLGTIMLVNVWTFIWQNQKKILGIVPASDDEKAKARRVAFLASRTNTMLSIPMIFFMATGPTSMSQFIYH